MYILHQLIELHVHFKKTKNSKEAWWYFFWYSFMWLHIWMGITKQLVHRFLLSSLVSVTIHWPWLGKRSIALMSFTLNHNSCSLSFPKKMIGCRSSLRHLDSAISFSVVRLQYCGAVHANSLRQRKWWEILLSTLRSFAWRSTANGKFQSIPKICFPNFKKSWY